MALTFRNTVEWKLLKPKSVITNLFSSLQNFVVNFTSLIISCALVVGGFPMSEK